MSAAKSKKRGKGGKKKSHLHFREQQSEGGHFEETVGGDLRMARMNRGLGVDDIAARLKIKPQHVRAIEESDFDALPGKTYAIGFVRSYAEIMEARSEEYIRRFKAEMTGAEEIKFNSITARDKKKPFPIGQFVTAAVTVVLAVTVWRTADTAIEAGGDVLERFKPTPPLEIARPGGETESLDAQVSFHERAGAFNPSELALSSPNEIFPSQAIAQLEKDREPVVAAQVADELILASLSKASDLLDGTYWGSENHDARMRIKALDNVWLRIEVEGRVMFERVLKSGESYSPPNSQTTVIATRNAGGLEIYVDGAYVRRLGDEGASLAGAHLDADILLSGG
jgi:cytoskeleton protein RodZ